MNFYIGCFVKTSASWRCRYPRKKARGVGTVVNITAALNGPTFSVKWESGKYDQYLGARDLISVCGEDLTSDHALAGKGW